MIHNTRFHPTSLPLLAVILLLASCVAASAANVNGMQTSPTVSLEQIEAKRQAAQSDTTLDENQKKKALELCDQATKWLQQANDARAQLAQLQSLLDTAPQRIEAIRSGDARSTQDMPALESIVASGKLEQIELAAAQERLAMENFRETERKYADELSRLLVGNKNLSEEIANIGKTIEQIEKDLEAPPSGETPASLAQVQKLVLQARRMLREIELSQLKLRLGGHDLLTNLSQAERDFAAAQTSERQKRLEQLDKAARQLREERARRAREEADELEAESESRPSVLQAIARENARYRLELEELVGREQAVIGDLQAARLRLDEIKNDFERTRERVEVVGETHAIGKMLKRRRQELPSLQNYRRTSAERGEEINQATDRQIEIDELLRDRSDLATLIEGLRELIPEPQWSSHEQAAMELIRARRDALNELQKVYGRYIGQITSLDLAERQLVAVSEAFVDYIDDQLIWIPGPTVVQWVDPDMLQLAAAWLLSPSHWHDMVQDLWRLAGQRPVALFGLLWVFALLLHKRHRSLERLGDIGRDTRKIRTDSFILTVFAVGHTLLAISAWPLLLTGIGWLLSNQATVAPFTLSMARGMIGAGILLFSGRFLIQICLPDNVGDKHLRWSKPIRESVAREIRWILPISVPLGFLIAAGWGLEPAEGVNILSRFSFVLLMLASAAFVYRLLRRNGRIMQALDGQSQPSLMVQLHFLWFPAAVLVPVAFAVTAGLGYYQAALHLQHRAELTFWLFVGLFLTKELVLRSLYIAERRLRLEDALRRRDELRAQRALSEEAPEEDEPQVSLDIPELDFDELSEQSRRLVRAGFLFGSVIGIWTIWSALLPAMGFLNETQLPLHATRIVDGIAKEVPVTLGDLTLGIIMVLITALAAKNIPGVLEIALLQRLPLESGARYAITALTQYTIVGIGVMLAFSTLGLQWSSIQWLVAALGVGLGFGLQEIVANFISGIILLFERPIRVGDVVTIDNTTGTVTRIRIRATTITNWDKQELLIPNKEFITGRVINWTLSNKLNRLVITVGVAYGTDVNRALDLMLEAARENENVLEEPPPFVSFEAFGDNALTLVLRCYLGSMDYRISTTTAVHKAINDKFNAAGINIAFPQRDIHLNASAPLDIRLHRPSTRQE